MYLFVKVCPYFLLNENVTFISVFGSVYAPSNRYLVLFFSILIIFYLFWVGGYNISGNCGCMVIAKYIVKA